MKRFTILAASAGLLLAAQSLPLAAGDGEDRRLEPSGVTVPSTDVEVTRRGTMAIAQPVHISDDGEYRRETTFKARKQAAAGRMTTMGESRWGPLHISDDGEARRDQLFK